ncbi:MAG: hypothetical protein P4L83_08485 [Nevskia sp.]|nr:hypothetical protein [Nevskia sp.]
MVKLLRVLPLAVLSGTCCADEAPLGASCKANPEVVAACFEVHGRLSAWNGAPAFRIWPAGTQRMLGIHNSELPAALRSRMTDFDTELWGTFTVCPFTPERAGHMRMVCVESWRDLVARERKPPRAP